MSYSYPSKLFGFPADVDAVATALAQRQSDSATTGGGIDAGGGAAVPQLGVDAAGLGVAYLKAIADVTLIATGIVGQDDQATSSDSTTSSSFVDAAGYPTWTVSVPLAKTYTLDVDLELYVQGSASIGQFEIQVDGSSPAGQPTNAQAVRLDQVLTTTRVHFQVLVALSAGSHTFKLRWKRTLGAGTLTVSASPQNFRCFTLRG